MASPAGRHRLDPGPLPCPRSPVDCLSMKRVKPAPQAGDPTPAPDEHRTDRTEAEKEEARSPLPLARPLELFESECAVAGSVAHCLPDPDTAVRIVWGLSPDGTLRRLEPRMHQAMRKMRYILEKRHEPSETTVKVIAVTLAAVMPQGTTTRLLRGELAESDLPRFLPWREYQRGMGPVPDGSTTTAFDEIVAYVVGRETFYARLFHHERAGRDSPERAALEQRMQQGLVSWRALNPGLMRSVFPLVEELLHGIAWLELRLRPSTQADSIVLALLAPKRRPMGHWLGDVSQASGAESLAGLEQVLFKLDVRYKGENKGNPFIKADTLKKWSASGQMLMPPHALSAVLSGVPEEQRPRLEGRYFLARVLTYLMALVRAGTQGESPTWPGAQEQVRSRYTEVHRLLAQLASQPS